MIIPVKQDFDAKSGSEKNLLIVEKYNKDGFFPLLLIVSKTGKIIAKMDAYNNESPAAYVARLRSLNRN